MVARTEVVTLRYFGPRQPHNKQWSAHEAVQAGHKFVGIAGASRSGKTEWMYHESIDLLLRYPGISGLMGRLTDDATERILVPGLYDVINTCYHRDILATHLPNNGWSAKEHRQHFANGSSLYMHGLKSSDDTNRYAKFDGHNLGFYALSQAEELPRDIWDRLKTRLSQKGPYPRCCIFELNPVTLDHYLHREFVKSPKPGYICFPASVYDNAHNLPPGYIEQLEMDYPVGHPLRRRLIEGGWGLESRGDPIVGELFSLEIHRRATSFDEKLPLILSYDPGARHPALTWAQLTVDGQLRVLACLIGTDIFADDFFAEAFQLQRELFGIPEQVLACADKASEQRHGNSRKTEYDIFKDQLKPWGVTPKTGLVASKEFLIQKLASRFTRLVRGQPAIVFDPRCEYLTDAMMQGWVWKPPTDLRPTAREPLDNYYAHGADTLLYIDMHFGPGVRRIKAVEQEVRDTAERAYRPRTTAGY